MALGEALAVGTDDERHVDVLRRRQPEQALQQHLARRRRQQVVTTHHRGDLLVGVVDHDRQVVRRHAVVAAQHDVVDDAVCTPANRSWTAIAPSSPSQADRRRALASTDDALARGQITARPGVTAVGVVSVRRRHGLPDLAAGAVALVRQTAGVQMLDGVVVEREPLALADDVAVVVEAERREVGELLALVLDRRGRLDRGPPCAR